MNFPSIRPLQPASSGSRKTALFAGFVALLAIAPAHAATRYWSGNGSTAGGDGIWSTSTVNRWATATAGPWTLAWNNAGDDTAENSSATANITLGGNIILGGFTQKAGGGSTSNSIEQGSGPYTLTLGIAGANTFLAAATSTTGRSLIINAAIAGGEDNQLVLAGPNTSGTATFTLGRANTFSGNTSFTSGATGGARAILKNSLAFQNSTVTLSASANITFDSAVSANEFTFGGLAAEDAGTGFDLALVNNNAATPIALTVGGNDSSTTYSGAFSGGGSLIKTGTGTLTLDSANTFTGPTTISGGTLQLDGTSLSPTTVNNGATLAGSGLVNANVTMNAGGTVTAGDGTAGTLSVSNLALSGTGTINVGELSGYTSAAAIDVAGLLTHSGGPGAVTINLPTAPGFNGVYHLIQFASGITNANGFALGTVPTLSWNQSGALEVNGNFLDYVITAAGDTTPPVLANFQPANNATNVLPDTSLVATFNETVVAGSGSIELRRSSNGALVESFNVATSPQLTFSTAQLIIQPTNALATNLQYYVLIPVGTVKDTSGNNYAGITSTTGWRFTVPAPVVLYTDTGSPANPLWSAILPTLNYQSSDPGPVYGSVINVNNSAVQVGLYGNRPISIGSQRIHVACNTTATNFANFTRWFQTDGNTQVLRVFVNDENTATSRAGTSSHTEVFRAGGWNHGNNMTYEWTGRYTIARLKQSYACFQLKNTDNDWAFQLVMSGSGALSVNNRIGADVLVTNPDGSPKNFNGGGFDVRVLDDGKFYKVWIDGVLYASGSYTRPTGSSTFRWGMYFGANNLNPPADYNLVLVSGAQVRSWPGKLATATTAITKANNATNLNNGASWVGGVVPGIYNQALWNSTVGATNTTSLAGNQQWAGIRIVNPGGEVTINGSSLLGLEAAGVNMTSATRNLVVNCPVQMAVPSSWSVASGRTATFNGEISGYPGLTVSGGGTVVLNSANTYGGDTSINGGTLEANDNSALGTGLLVFNGGSLSSSTGCSLANGVDLGSNASISVEAPQTLALNGSISGTGSLTKGGEGTLNLSGANSYTGPTIASTGTLAVGHTSALLTTSGLTLADGTVLQPRLDGVIISAPITLAGVGTNATISAPTNSPGGGVTSTLTLNSVLAGSGNVTFLSSVSQNALSTVYLGAQSTYTGSTLINTTASTDGTTTSGENQIVVKLGINNALPTTTVVTIDGGNGSGSARYADLNLNGYSQQLAGLTNITRSGAKAVLRKQRVVNSDAATPATLTIHNSIDRTFTGYLGGTGGSVSGTSTPGSTNGDNFSLVKTGNGTFTLGVNASDGGLSYAGDTTVHGGILSLGRTNESNDLSAVTIAATGAKLKLDFTGTDTVDKLFIGTSRKPAGQYGHGSTGATNGGLGVGAMNAWFEPGTGTLTVTTGAGGYAAWKAINAPATGNAPNADEDGDGVTNGVEYVLGGLLGTNDLGKLPTISTSGGNMIFTFQRDQASIDGTTTQVIEAGTTLASWPNIYPVPDGAAANNPGVTVLKNSPAAGWDTVILTLPLTPGGKTFTRLKVTP